MRTYPYTDDTGVMYAFDIDNIGILTPLARALQRVEGVTSVQIRKLFSKPTNIHIHFMYKGVRFVVLEPYADSSIYEIRSEDPNIKIDVSQMERALRQNAPVLLGTVGEFYNKLLSRLRS